MGIFELLRELAADGCHGAPGHPQPEPRRRATPIAWSLLDRGRLAAEGAPSAVLRPELLERIYSWPLRITTHPGPGHDTGAPQLTPLARLGSPGGDPDPVVQASARSDPLTSPGTNE